MAYGIEMWCGDRLVSGRYSRGVLTVALALYRRLRTPRGTLRGGDAEAAYGIDLASYVGAVGYQTALGTLPNMVAAELSKDERVAAISVEVYQETDPSGLMALTLEVDVRLHDEDAAFQLVVSVSNLATALISVNELQAS